MDFDLGVRQFQGQAPFDALCDFLRTLAHALGRSVWLGPEMATDDPMLSCGDVTLDRMVRLGGWWERPGVRGRIGRRRRR